MFDRPFMPVAVALLSSVLTVPITDDGIIGRAMVADPHKRRRFKMNARRQKGRKVCPAFRKGCRT